MSLQEKLEALKETTLLKIKESPTMNDLNQIRVEVLGKKVPLLKFYGDERSFCGRTAEGGELCQRDS